MSEVARSPASSHEMPVVGLNWSPQQIPRPGPLPSSQALTPAQPPALPLGGKRHGSQSLAHVPV